MFLRNFSPCLSALPYNRGESVQCVRKPARAPCQDSDSASFTSQGVAAGVGLLGEAAFALGSFQRAVLCVCCVLGAAA